jgi:NAD-dependent SIR2 family protein deacetylase
MSCHDGNRQRCNEDYPTESKEGADYDKELTPLGEQSEYSPTCGDFVDSATSLSWSNEMNQGNLENAPFDQKGEFDESSDELRSLVERSLSEGNSSDTQSDEDGQTRHVGRGVPLYLDCDDSHVDDIVYPFSPPRSLSDVAQFIRSEQCQSIAILAGAGMSVASGIPDFRSAGGLYDTLRPGLLTATTEERDAIRMDPTLALDTVLFLQNPLPCLELNRPFILGTRDRVWKATLAHRFVELLHVKTGKLTRLYQQNIDGLEGQCEKLPREKIIMVHGSMDEAECAACRQKSNFHTFCSQVEEKIKDLSGLDPKAPESSSPIACDLCSYEAMKPSIVLFRSPLPEIFFHSAQQDLPNVDLLLIIGTSLAVAPANSLVYRCPQTTMRVVINREPVGFRLGIDYSEHAKRDYFAKGDIDTVLLELVIELGWLDDLKEIAALLPEKSASVLNERIQQHKSCTKKLRVA